MLTKIYNWLEKKDEDLAGGLAVGLAGGLVGGLAGGLAVGLANLSQLMPVNFLSITALILGTFILAEILYGFNDKEKKPTLGRIAWLKADSVFCSLLIIINSLNIVWLCRNTRIDFDVVLQWIGYIGAGIISIAAVGGAIYLWLLWNKKRLTK